MDIRILYFLNGLTQKYIYLDALFIFLAVYFPILFAVFHFIFFYFLKKIKLWVLTWFIAAFSIFLKQIISLFYFRVRPFNEIAGVYKLINCILKDASFPSAHTAVAFVLAFGVFWVNKKWGILFLLCALLISISRIIVGVHFPTDILGGILIAFVLSLIIRRRVK